MATADARVSIFDHRAQLAAAAGTVDGVTGHEKRPAAPQPGDAWPLLTRLERAGAPGAWARTWRVLVALSTDETVAADWLEARVWDLVDALDGVGWVTTVEPVLITVARVDTPAVQITLECD